MEVVGGASWPAMHSAQLCLAMRVTDVTAPFAHGASRPAPLSKRAMTSDTDTLAANTLTKLRTGAGVTACSGGLQNPYKRTARQVGGSAGRRVGGSAGQKD